MSALRSIVLSIALVLLAVVVTGCGLLPFGALRPASGDPALPARSPDAAAVRADLADHLAAWRARALTGYTWTVSFECECAISGPVTVTVVGGSVTKTVMAGGGAATVDLSAFPLAVDVLYNQAIKALDGGGGVTVTWGNGGIPTRMLIDPIPNAVDDELNVTVTAFEAGS